MKFQDLLNAHSSFYEKLVRCQNVVTILELFTTWCDQMAVHGIYLYRLRFIQNSIDQLCLCNEPLNEQIKVIPLLKFQLPKIGLLKLTCLFMLRRKRCSVNM